MSLKFPAFLASGVLLTASAHAALISGPTQITATTDIPFNGGFGSVDQLVDGIGLNSDGPSYNGYGPNATSGTITFTLDGVYTLYDFILANDINVQHEGPKDFTLSFYDINNQLISTTGTLTAADATVTAQTFSLGTIENVARVDFNILNVYSAETEVVRIEIREVAFNGVPVPEPSATLLGVAGTLLVLRRRRA
ncbi:MAG: hypothetical protein QM755_17155 [Luteolibacter sp.]